MVGTNFVIKVKTGDRMGAGTDANVNMIIYDKEGNSSDEITLDNYLKDDFECGREDTFNVANKKVTRLSTNCQVSRIAFWRDSFGVGDSWFVDTVTVRNSVTGEDFVFPVFRWVKADYHYKINVWDTSLPKDEEFTEQRANELEMKRKKYIFDQKVEDGPAQIKEMPEEEAFTLGMKLNIGKKKMKLKALKVVKMMTGGFSSLSELDCVYTKTNFHKPKGVDRWRNDEYFGLQRVASLNHSLIRLVTNIPDNFPVTDYLLGSLLEGLTLQAAVEAKRLFICDLKIMEGLPVRDGYHLCAPIAMFFVNSKGSLCPVAIQLHQEPGTDNPIFTPSDDPLTWTLVKMWYNNADAGYHQALTHLGMTHFLMEGVTIATHRNLSPSHPVFKILAPHFLYLIAINTRGLEVLVAKDGWVDKTMNYGIQGMFELIRKGFKTWRMDVQGSLSEDLKDRGLDDEKVLPCYHFRDDAILLHNAITKYVTSYVGLYYTDDGVLQGDEEIQSWAHELVKERNSSEGGVGLLGVPGGGMLTDTQQLIQIITSLISTCSVMHASANFPQYEEYAFPPNYPSLLRGTPPTSKSCVTSEEDILATLPDLSTTLDIMIVTKILSEQNTNSLGDFEVQYIYDPPAVAVVEEFRNDLKEISKTIQERNLYRNPPYGYLNPEIVPNSISI